MCVKSDRILKLEVNQTSSIDLENAFQIGPTVSRLYWNLSPLLMTWSSDKQKRRCPYICYNMTIFLKAIHKGEKVLGNGEMESRRQSSVL